MRKWDRRPLGVNRRSLVASGLSGYGRPGQERKRGLEPREIGDCLWIAAQWPNDKFADHAAAQGLVTNSHAAHRGITDGQPSPGDIAHGQPAERQKAKGAATQRDYPQRHSAQG